jgi:hypothetical protein
VASVHLDNSKEPADRRDHYAGNPGPKRAQPLEDGKLVIRASPGFYADEQGGAGWKQGWATKFGYNDSIDPDVGSPDAEASRIRQGSPF